MGINIECTIKASFLERYITVGKMKELLSNLNDDWELLPNRVGNLNVYSCDSELKGFIDIGGEAYESQDKIKNI